MSGFYYSQNMSQNLRQEDWLNPSSGERARLSFDGQQVWLERGSQTDFDFPLALPSQEGQTADEIIWPQQLALLSEGLIQVSPRRADGALWLPPALEPRRPALEKLARPVVRPYVTGKAPQRWESKLGGVPYRLKGEPWPLDAQGQPLAFLAQLDLGAANAGGQLPDLPTRGLLQFFAGYGEGAVRYWPAPSHDETELDAEELTPTDDFLEAMYRPPERALAFVTDEEFPMSTDPLLTDVLGYLAAEGLPHPNGHRLRGYPMLINVYHPPESDTRLLFQYDDDDNGHQIYGESGGLGGWLGFFIRRESLERLDFAEAWLEGDAF